MKAFVLAAGLGSRLRPFTLEHPKALVPVGGVPMLERVLLRLKDEGFGEVVVNVHHFADQIEDFLKAKDNFGLDIKISDERTALLDTGGAILHARELLAQDSAPFLVHNVDILSNAPLRELMKAHDAGGSLATLLVSDRPSSRQLCFKPDLQLCGWHNLSTGEFKPAVYEKTADSDIELSFSGIHVLSPDKVYPEMDRQLRSGVFSIIDFYLEACKDNEIRGYGSPGLRLIDIGKPDTLADAERLFAKGS